MKIMHEKTNQKQKKIVKIKKTRVFSKSNFSNKNQ